MINIDRIIQFKNSYINKVKDVLTQDQEIVLDDFIEYIEVNDILTAKEIIEAIKSKMYDLENAESTEEFYNLLDKMQPAMKIFQKYFTK